MAINLETQKQKLETEQGELESELGKIGYKLPGNNWGTKPISDETDMEFRDEVADEMEDMEERRATEDALVKRLNNVKLALQKITENRYGICEVSGEAIEADRLEANPAARTCKNHLNQEGS